MDKKSARDAASDAHAGVVSKIARLRRLGLIGAAVEKQALRALKAAALGVPPAEMDSAEYEHWQLNLLAPLLTRALSSSHSGVVLVISDLRALVISTRTGKIRRVSAFAPSLLHLAGQGVWLANAPFPGTLPAPIVRLCRQRASMQKNHLPAVPLVWSRYDAWGALDCRVFLLQAASGTGAAHIGISMRYHEALPLKLLRDCELQRLTSRETDFCLLASAGLSRPQIAQRMGVTAHTANTFGRHIFAKLGVHCRAELLHLLQSPPAIGMDGVQRDFRG
ncbi:MAG: helix-turn-helix transcriptional regulator [Stenotrophobium sp.]